MHVFIFFACILSASIAHSFPHASVGGLKLDRRDDAAVPRPAPAADPVCNNFAGAVDLPADFIFDTPKRSVMPSRLQRRVGPITLPLSAGPAIGCRPLMIRAMKAPDPQSRRPKGIKSEVFHVPEKRRLAFGYSFDTPVNEVVVMVRYEGGDYEKDKSSYVVAGKGSKWGNTLWAALDGKEADVYFELMFDEDEPVEGNFEGKVYLEELPFWESTLR